MFGRKIVSQPYRNEYFAARRGVAACVRGGVAVITACLRCGVAVITACLRCRAAVVAACVRGRVSVVTTCVRGGVAVVTTCVRGVAAVIAACVRCGAAVVAAAIGFVLAACGGGVREGAGEMVVSIEPLRYIVEGITGDDFRVVVLTPPGANPETYEPTPEQMAVAEDAQLIFSTGLVAFERELVGRLPRHERSVDLSEGIPLIESDHSHAPTQNEDRTGHGAESGQEQEHEHEHEHSHVHAPGADPHIWMSPRALARMAETAYERIHEAYPDSISYTVNYERFAERLTRLDKEVSRRLADAHSRAFMILHPGLTYYARDYGLRQIAIERDGKEPSVGQLAQSVAEARAEGVSLVLYQSEFPVRAVEVAAAEIGSEPVEIDILGYDVVGNILKITDLIAR